MAQVQRVKTLSSQMKTLRKNLVGSASKDKVSVIVGYTAAYAIYVHEDLTKRHGKAYNDAYIKQEEEEITRGKNKGKTRVKLSWKRRAIELGYDHDGKGGEKKPKLRGENQTAQYLVIPARRLKPVFPKIVTTAVANGASLLKALLITGRRLQRESQQIVPVDTGHLKATAFTKEETNDATAQPAANTQSP